MTVLADRYELGEPVGTGGMAQVFAAHDHVLQRQVAVKLIHTNVAADPRSCQRMLQEARAAARLDHPHTVTVFDAGEVDGRPFIVMEMVDGHSLAHRLTTAGRLDVDEAVDVADAVLSALHAAHQHGLVHRDVKPSNILLPASGGVKLADFGIAKALDQASSGLTGTGQLLGTPRYLAPERALGEPASPASDIYSVAVVLFECLVGEAPYPADTPLAEAMAHQREPVPSVADIAPFVPPSVARAIERALAKDPAERFADAATMRRALHDTAVGLPPPPPPAIAASDPHTTRRLDISGQSDADHTRVLDPAAIAASPGRRRSHARSRASKPWPWIVLSSAAAVVAVVVLALTVLGEDELPDASGAETTLDDGTDPADAESDGADDGADEEPEDVEETESDGADDQADDGADEDREPADLEELIAVLASSGTDAGEKHEDLVDELTKLRRERDDRKRTEEGYKLIEKVGSWVAEDKLDARTGRTAVTLLEAFSRPDHPALAPVSNLLADVAIAPRDWGENADELMSDLREVLKADRRRKRAEEAEDLIEEVEEWIDDGEISRAQGRRVLDVLRPLQRRR